MQSKGAAGDAGVDGRKDVAGEGGVRGSLRYRRKGTNALGHRAHILEVNILRSNLRVVQRGLDIGMTHQPHERGQTNSGAYHVRGKGVPKAMGIGDSDAGCLSMVAEQRGEGRQESCVLRAQALSARRTARQCRDRAVPGADNDPVTERFPGPAARSAVCCLCHERAVVPRTTADRLD